MSRKIFIDAGANDGSSVELFRKAFKDHDEYDIYSFEPNLEFENKLKEKDIHYSMSAVWIFDGEVEFYVDSNRRMLGSTLIKEKTTGALDRGNPSVVKCIDFDQWIRYTFKKTDYIIVKLDIEGAEWKVLDKMIEGGSIEYIDELYGEWHVGKVGKSINDLNQMKNNLKEYGLKMLNWCAESSEIGDVNIRDWNSHHRFGYRKKIIKNEGEK